MEYKILSDIELARELVNGNIEDAFCEPYIRYCKKLQLFCPTFIKKEKEAEDIVHEVFETIWKNRQQINIEIVQGKEYVVLALKISLYKPILPGFLPMLCPAALQPLRAKLLFPSGYSNPQVPG